METDIINTTQLTLMKMAKKQIESEYKFGVWKTDLYRNDGHPHIEAGIIEDYHTVHPFKKVAHFTTEQIEKIKKGELEFDGLKMEPHNFTEHFKEMRVVKVIQVGEPVRKCLNASGIRVYDTNKDPHMRNTNYFKRTRISRFHDYYDRYITFSKH